MSGKIVLLKPARTKNLAAWLSKVFEESSNASSMCVLTVREHEVDGETEATCTIDYFNMDEYVYTWAAAKIGDSATLMRGHMVHNDAS